MSYRAYGSLSRGWRSAVTGRAVLQRKCDCGNHTNGGECDECAEKKNEIQRKPTGAAVDRVPPIVHDVLGESGRPLDTDASASMGASFGHDFSGVRIHADTRAAESARAIHAQAYTVGRDIVFGSGEYAPETSQGRRLLAHELAHVVQQDSATPASSSAISMGDSTSGEVEADRAADGAVSGSRMQGGARADIGVQRKPAAGSTQSNASSQSAGASGTAACIEAVAGEDIPSLMQAGVITILEFGATWCGPCKMNQASLEDICRKFRTNPPPVPVRIYSLDVDAPGNEEAAKKYAPASVPHLYFFVGSSQKAHYEDGLEPDAMDAAVAEQIEYASTSGAWRGAKKGAKWGLIPGAAAGLGGAIALGAGAGGLQGNALMGGILGSIAGGLAAGALLGGAIGAIAGAIGDDRKKGPKDQKRRKLQPKLRGAPSNDPLERDADAWAERIAGDTPARAAQATTNARGQPLDAPTRGFMESRFGRGFGDVRVHRDPHAHAVADGLDAHAVTSDSDIYFAADSYAPQTAQGRSILGHELAHVAQNTSSGSKASEGTLEGEADRAAHAIGTGARPEIRHASDRPLMAMKRWQKTLAGVGIGAAAVGAAGVGVGLATAALSGGSLGTGALVGGLIGAGVGALVGGLIGFFQRRTTPEGTAEAEALIQKRYGKYLRGGASGPLHNASVHVVSQAELCERNQCRNPGAACNMVGWTDTGVPLSPAAGPQNQNAPIPSQSAEPTCNGKQMEHATPDKPVIYYMRDGKMAGVLIHEGLHAHAHPDYGFLHNHIAEGTTEYFTRQLQDDVNMPYLHGYDDEVKSVEKLVDLVGEETVARAYFGGAVAQLHEAVNSKLGGCALITWAFSLQMGSDRRAEEIFERRNQNYCNSNELPSGIPQDLTPSSKPAAAQKSGPNAAQPQSNKPHEESP